MPRFFICDTETASLKGGIVDFALIEIDENLDVIRTVECLLDPMQPIAAAAQEIHGISQQMIEDQPTAAEYRERDGNPFDHDDIIFIAHNAQFDVRMLTADGFIVKPVKQVCTLRMARNLWPDIDDQGGNHKLGTLAVMFNLERGPAHRAMGDAVTCLNLLRHMAIGASSFDELMDMGTRTLSLETKIGFGKHKGTKLKNLPSDYVSWLTKQADMDQDLKAALSLRPSK